ncbi:MAG: nitroreductase-like protein [Gammaproteobacteria bacterium]|nr:MAG: nitroreductase-like protein [Gammaproteobacteria bacterium]
MKAIIKKILAPSVILKLKYFISLVDNKIFPFFAHHAFLSSFYYCFLNRKFYREHKAVLQGRLHYRNSLENIEQSSFLLRRNIHRLEKGLIMKPRREVFAQAYITETLNCYQQCLFAKVCEEELKWTHDVLTAYFKVVSDTAVIATARKLFFALDKNNTNSSTNYVPYSYKDRTSADVSTVQLEQLFKQRRSVRWFQQKPVALSTIEKAIELAALAPSACNRQPFTFHVITDQEKAHNIAKIAVGTAGFAENIPALLAIVGDLSAYPLERDRHVVYIDSGLAAMQLMLALETLGLSSCPLNWPDIENLELKMATQLELPYYQKPIMLLAVGYADPDGEIPYSQKKKTKLLIKEVH